MTNASTLRLRNTYLYGFRALFDICNFLATSYGLWKLGKSVILFNAKFAPQQTSTAKLAVIFLRFQIQRAGFKG